MAALLLASTGAVGIGVAVAAAGFQTHRSRPPRPRCCHAGQSNRLWSEPPAALLIAALFFLLHSVFDWAHRPGLLSVQFVPHGGRWAAGSMAHTSRFCVCSHGSGEGSMAEIRRRRSAWVSGLMPSSVAGPARRRHGDDGRGQCRRPARPACRRASPHAHTTTPADRIPRRRSDARRLRQHVRSPVDQGPSPPPDTGAYFPMAAYPRVTRHVRGPRNDWHGHLSTTG